MKRSSKIILTAVLITGISGAVFAYGAHRNCHNASVEEKADMMNYYISSKLDLNSAQEVYLEQLTARGAQIFDEVRAERANRQQMVDQLLGEGPFDQTALLQKISDKTQRVNQVAPEMVALIGQFVDSLEVEQKAELKQMLAKRRGFGGWGRHFGGHSGEREMRSSGDL